MKQCVLHELSQISNLRSDRQTFFEHILRYFANMYVLIFYTLYVYRVFYMDLYPFHMAHPVFFAADLLLLHIL